MKPNSNLKTYSLKDMEYYKIYGRTDETQYPLPLFFNGSGIEVNVTGSELWIDIDVDYDMHEPWIFTRLNNSFMSRQMLMSGSYSLCLFRSMSPDTVKNMKFFRELQAMSEDDSCHILIRGFRTDGFFLPVSNKKYKLEFIGDSITSGEGTYGAKEDTDWLAMYMGVSRNYALMVSDALDAEFRLVSQGGWGVLCGWDNDPRHNIPSRYEKICGLAGGKMNESLGASKPYRFESWKPDAIIVNLGTNDASAFNQPEWTNPETGETFKQHKNPDGSFDPDDLNRF
ncbi:MAG: GDSL family lipase, partial [Suilimivivens sp.]